MPKRSMIIVWWWLYGGQETEVEYWDIDASGKDDVLIRADLPYSEVNIATLVALIKKQVGREVLLLLHRNHGYNAELINKIKSRLGSESPNINIHLFGEGSGYVYLNEHPRGILGTKGKMNVPKVDGVSAKEMTAISTKVENAIKAAHYEYVWTNYMNVWVEKLMAFKEDLFTSLLPIIVQHDDNVYAFLKEKEQRLMMLRIMSFIGRLTKGSTDEIALVLFEKEHNISYQFEGFAEWTKGREGVESSFKEMKKMMKQQLLSTGSKEWGTLRKGLDDLINMVHNQLILP